MAVPVYVSGTGGRHRAASVRVVARFMHACTSCGPRSSLGLATLSANLATPPPEIPWKKRKPPAKKTKTVVSATALKFPSSVVSGVAPARIAASAASRASTCFVWYSATVEAGSGHACCTV
eukprot:CAMPEP_0119060384 /NCGR_PEP_ID=MMETSP1178-20130426/4348_1 /TAXON_ID=33656 /ORGANISM="unid sp, Strain CCMP2000" /LENGTH=120 /DNA_ID=CAMNT_0007041481 /DNA_START=102 /DNA_END=464 /DNA_ORIENTATION=+